MKGGIVFYSLFIRFIAMMIISNHLICLIQAKSFTKPHKYFDARDSKLTIINNNNLSEIIMLNNNETIASSISPNFTFENYSNTIELSINNHKANKSFRNISPFLLKQLSPCSTTTELTTTTKSTVTTTTLCPIKTSASIPGKGNNFTIKIIKIIINSSNPFLKLVELKWNG
jgi:hypothetical protein